MKLYTIGHSNLEIENFIELLKNNNVNILVDVRSSPYSKHVPDFNRSNLKKFMKNSDISYIFLGSKLGGKPQDESFYQDGKIKYSLIEKSSLYNDGISEIVLLSQNKNIVLMCSEEDPNSCHRHNLIAQNLINIGFEVFHIRKDGSIEKAKLNDIQKTLF